MSTAVFGLSDLDGSNGFVLNGVDAGEGGRSALALILSDESAPNTTTAARSLRTRKRRFASKNGLCTEVVGGQQR